MTQHAAWDGTNENIHSNSNEDLGLDHPYEPWKSLTKSIKTVTASIRPIQNIFRKENKRSLNSDDFAEALLKRGVLRNVITIQISSNQNFVSIEFGTKQMMETFCTEPLEIRSFTITFSPETKKSRKPKLLNISFLNVSSETPDDILTEFLNEYADIKGFPFYPKKHITGYPTAQELEFTKSLNYTNTYRENFTAGLEERLYVSIITNPTTTEDQRDHIMNKLKLTLMKTKTIMIQTQLKLKVTRKVKMKQETKPELKTSPKTNQKYV